ncbi:unnamed protein product [Allacma fusca]|uniref:Uncharacterized protein n=1 Tax=Allacma fusca TaxID=39272 RepID=A0A8J2J8U6_9HEXA|nr:unnamed protein product [Allacma fusca]
MYMHGPMHIGGGIDIDKSVSLLVLFAQHIKAPVSLWIHSLPFATDYTTRKYCWSHHLSTIWADRKVRLEFGRLRLGSTLARLESLLPKLVCCKGHPHWRRNKVT